MYHFASDGNAFPRCIDSSRLTLGDYDGRDTYSYYEQNNTLNTKLFVVFAIWSKVAIAMLYRKISEEGR